MCTVEGPMKDLVEAIAKALVDHPDKVQGRSVDGEQVTVLEVRVHAGMKIRKRLTLEILE